MNGGSGRLAYPLAPRSANDCAEHGGNSLSPQVSTVGRLTVANGISFHELGKCSGCLPINRSRN